MQLTSHMLTKTKDSSQNKDSNNYNFYDKNKNDDHEYTRELTR